MKWYVLIQSKIEKKKREKRNTLTLLSFTKSELRKRRRKETGIFFRQKYAVRNKSYTHTGIKQSITYHNHTTIALDSCQFSHLICFPPSAITSRISMKVDNNCDRNKHRDIQLLFMTNFSSLHSSPVFSTGSTNFRASMCRFIDGSKL